MFSGNCESIVYCWAATHRKRVSILIIIHVSKSRTPYAYDEEENGGDIENKHRWNAMWQRHDKLSTK